MLLLSAFHEMRISSPSVYVSAKSGSCPSGLFHRYSRRGSSSAPVCCLRARGDDGELGRPQIAITGVCSFSGSLLAHLAASRQQLHGRHRCVLLDVHVRSLAAGDAKRRLLDLSPCRLPTTSRSSSSCTAWLPSACYCMPHPPPPSKCAFKKASRRRRHRVAGPLAGHDGKTGAWGRMKVSSC